MKPSNIVRCVVLLVALVAGTPLCSAQPAAPGAKPAQASATSLSEPDVKLYAEATNLIQVYSGSGDALERAYRILTDLAQRNPQSAYPAAGFAELKYRLASMGNGTIQEAFSIAQSAIKIDPAFADPYVVVAKVMLDQNNIVAATQAADKAIALAPKKPEAMVIKARIEQRAQRYGDAERWYRQAIEAHSDPERKSNVYNWLGGMLVQKKPRDIAGAITAYEKCIDLTTNPAPWKLNNVAGFFITYTDRYDQAIDYLNRAMKVGSFNAARTNLGLAQFFKWGDAQMNPGKYKKSATTQPLDPQTITEKTGVAPEYAFAKNPLGPTTPWATMAMLRSGMIKDVDVVAPGVGGTALISAAYGNHLDLVKMLVTKGANVNAEDKENRSTAIFYAVDNGNIDMVRFLVERGARLNVVDGRKRPLAAAALDNTKPDDIRILSYVLEKGADSTITDQNGNSLLAVAAMQPNAAAVRLLVQKYRSDPNGKMSGGMPVLASAAVTSGPSKDVVEVLLEAGANPWVKFGPFDVLSTLARSINNTTLFPSFKENMEMIVQARKSVPRPADFGRAYGEQ